MPDRTPMTITAKNGRSFQKIIFHIGAYGFNAALAYVDHGDLEVFEEGATLVVTNIHSDTITLHSNNDDLFQVSSVEVIYHDSSNSYLTTVTVNTEPVAAHCDQRTASYTYRNHTYTHNFENSAVLIHNFHYDYVWELREETTVEFTDFRGKTITRTVAQPVITGVSRTCEGCGLHENASGFEQQSVQTVSPTYTTNGAIKFPAQAWFEDGTTHTESYNYELPHYTLVHYPAVTPTCEAYGFEDVWYDQETHRCYSNAEGTNYVTTADNHLQTAVFISGKMMYLDRIDNKQQLSDQLCFYMTASADGSLQLVRLTPEQIDAMSSVTDMPADFTPVGLNDIASLTDVPDLGTLIISNNENPAQTLPINPLGHLCNPETEVTFNWDLKETIWYVWSNELQTQLEVSGFRPCAAASFICDRCGTTISQNVDRIETINGTAPTFDSDGWEEFTVYVDLNGYTHQATHTSVIPKFERIYTKVEAKEATFTEAGNIEYYSCNDGNFYVKNGETYTKVARDAVVIPPQGFEKINTNTYDNEYTGNLAIVNGWGGGSDGIYIENEVGTETGNTEYYTGSDGKYYVKNNDIYTEIAEGAWIIPALSCTVTWKNYDGTVLETDENVEYGAVPAYDGDTPAKAATAQYSYTFSGWSPAVAAVTGDVTYTAQFSETVNTYSVSITGEHCTIILKDSSGRVIANGSEVPYGTTVTYEAVAEQGYYIGTGGTKYMTETMTVDGNIHKTLAIGIVYYHVSAITLDAVCDTRCWYAD